jgi:HAD superfamily hydrolase (TIGR01509 family)
MTQIQSRHKSSIAAVIFDLDGVLLDSEPVWEQERRSFVAEHGGHWQPDSQQKLMGMSTSEWANYLSSDLGVTMPPTTIESQVIERMKQRYDGDLPLIDGAVEAVRRLADRWQLGIASSSPRALLDLVLDRARLTPFFKASVSSDEVQHGKPAPDVYVEAAKRLDAPPAECVAVEDSSNGLRAAANAGLQVIAIPNKRYPPDADALASAGLVLHNLGELTASAVDSLAAPS